MLLFDDDDDCGGGIGGGGDDYAKCGLAKCICYLWIFYYVYVIDSSSVVILMMMEGLERGPLEDCACKTLTNAVGKSMIDLRSAVVNLCQKLCSTWH